MKESLRLFNDICKNPLLKNSNIILFLNKKDLLASKLKHVQFVNWYPEYKGGYHFLFTSRLTLAQRVGASNLIYWTLS